MKTSLTTTLALTLLALVLVAPTGGVAFAANNNNGNGNGHSNEQNNSGYDKDGYDREGRDRDGYDHEGYDRNDRDRNGHSRKDKGNAYGYGGNKVEVCRETGSKWFPYVKVTVPLATAEKWEDDGKAADLDLWPNEDGKCPTSKVSFREHFRNIFAKWNWNWHFPSFAHR